jgi:adenylate cyclase
MHEIAADLGVRYLLEGSVRRAGNRVRINAQLVDAITGNHEWADRYDGSVENVFELQDKVAGNVVSALSIQLTLSESNSLKRVHTNNLEAYELFVSARATPYPPIPKRIEQARQMFKKVIELDSEYAGGYAGESFMISFQAIWGYGENNAKIEQAIALANKAIDVDDTFSWSYTSLAMGLLLRKQYEVAINAAKQAIWLQPNDADAHAFHGLIQVMAGRYQQGIESIKQAIRYNPQFFNGPYLNLLGIAYLLSGNDAKAVDSFMENISRAGPVGPPALCFHAVACVGLGRDGDAGVLVSRIFTEFPNFTLYEWNFLGLIHQDEVTQRIIRISTDLGVPG